MAAPDNDESVDPAAVRRHRILFRAIEKRRHPKLRRSDITVTDDAAVKRATKAAALGNAMEWYDFGIYSYLAVTIGKVFFPSGSDTAQLLSSFATFAVAFLVRPARRHGLRAARRQDRPQAHPLPHHDHDGGGDLRHRSGPLARRRSASGPRPC